MKVFCSRCRLVGTGMLNLKPESCSSLQWTCLQYSTSCSRRMKLFWLSWKYVIDGGRTQSVEGSVGSSSNLLSNLLLQANVNRQNGYPSIHTSIHASIFLGPFHEDIIPSAVPLCLLSIFFQSALVSSENMHIWLILFDFIASLLWPCLLDRWARQECKELPLHPG